MTTKTKIAHKKLRRLSRARRPFSDANWYVEPDYLLLANNQRLRVDYRRFYYSDLRFVLATADPRWWWRVGLAPLFAAALAFMAIGSVVGIVNLASRRVGTLRDSLLGAAISAALTLIFQFVRGPFTRTLIQTSYGDCNVPISSRWSGAVHPLQQLTELMRQAQMSAMLAPSETLAETTPVAPPSTEVGS